MRPAPALLAAATVAATIASDPTAALAQAFAPKVMVITMFDAETKPWLEGRDLATRIAVPGLAPDFPEVACDPDLCVMTTAMGYANAAASTTALAFSDALDLRRTYIIVAGIAGVDPQMGTLGSAHWARYVVDAGLRHQIDPREIPPGWTSGALALGAAEPGAPAGWAAGSEVYRLDEALLQAALQTTLQTPLADSPEAATYRAAYTEAAARSAPFVSICDTASGDTYWHGAMIAADVEALVELRTQGAGDYCTTQMEDNATLTALARAAAAGRVDLARVAVLRTASNFDRPAPGQTAAESLAASSGGFGPATANAFRVADALAARIIADWSAWETAAPATQ